MSGPKYSDYDLEQARRRRLREALEIRKAAYCDAVNERQKLLKQVEASRKFLESKKRYFEGKPDKRELDECRPEESELEKLRSVYRRQVGEIEAALSECADIINRPIPEMDNRTESESTECEEADWINRLTEQLKPQFDRLLAAYNKTEKRTGEEVRQIGEYIKAKEKLKEQRKKSEQAVQQFAEGLQKIVDSQGSVSETENAVAEVRAVRAALLEEAGKLLRRPIPEQAEQVRTLTAETARGAEALMETADRSIQRPLEQMKRFAASREKVAGILHNFEAQQKRTASLPELTKIEDVTFAEYEEPDYYKTLEENARRELDSLLDRIEDTVCDDSVCAEDALRLGAIYQSIQETAEQARGSLAGQLIQAQDILGQVKERAEYFEECYCRYTTACEMLNRLYAANGEQDKQIDILGRLDYDSVEDLLNEEARINGILVQENERYFLRDTIKEVMERFGYNMAEELVLHRKQKGFHLLCKRESGDTGIHVHYSNGAKKRIMLEVVGVGKTAGGELEKGVNGKRIGPEGLSENRRRELLAQQSGFCLIHPQIVAALEEKGIRTNAIELNPPGMEFCEEIALAGKQNAVAEKKKRNRRKRETPKFMEKRMSKRRF